MQTLGKAVVRSGMAGEPLPTVYQSLAKAGINFRRSATSMFGAWPGSFKTAFALNLMLPWAKAGLHGIYISADDDAIGVGGRLGAMHSGFPVAAVERGLRDGSDYYVDTLKPVENVRFVFSATDIEEVDRRMVFHRTMFGKFPDFVFVDNLMNVCESDNEWTEMRNMTRSFALMARDSGTHICILHHTSESIGTVGVPPPRAAIQGKVNQFPQLVLTLGCSGTALNVCPVKNRHGPSDPSGQNIHIPFQVFPDTMRIDEMWAATQLKIGA